MHQMEFFFCLSATILQGSFFEGEEEDGELEACLVAFCVGFHEDDEGDEKNSCGYKAQTGTRSRGAIDAAWQQL